MVKKILRTLILLILSGNRACSAKDEAIELAVKSTNEGIIFTKNEMILNIKVTKEVSTAGRNPWKQSRVPVPYQGTHIRARIIKLIRRVAMSRRGIWVPAVQLDKEGVEVEMKGVAISRQITDVINKLLPEKEYVREKGTKYTSKSFRITMASAISAAAGLTGDGEVHKALLRWGNWNSSAAAKNYIRKSYQTGAEWTMLWDWLLHM